MKKHDEGYVLAYVTVVLLIFCLVAALVLTGAMRNLNHQQDSIQQMQDQYVAEGMIEQVLAQWSKLEPGILAGEKVGTTDVACKTIEDGVYELTATYGNVMVTCKVDKSGKVISYQIGNYEQPPTPPEEVLP